MGFPNAPHYVSTHAELFLFVAVALLSVICLLNTLCAVRGKSVFDKFASFRRQWATQALVAYAIVYIKPGSAMYSFAMPAGGLLVHALMFGRDRKLCTGGILLVMAACAWATHGLSGTAKSSRVPRLPPHTPHTPPLQGSRTVSWVALCRRRSSFLGTRAPRSSKLGGGKKQQSYVF